MSRRNSPIEDVDRIAREEGIDLAEDGKKGRKFEAFGRVFKIHEVKPGKVGLFEVSSYPADDEDAMGYAARETHDRIRKLFRRAAAKATESVA